MSPGVTIATPTRGWVGQLSAVHDVPYYYLRYAIRINGIVCPAPGPIAGLADVPEPVQRRH